MLQVPTSGMVMANSPSFQQLLSRFQHGSSDAVAEMIVQRFAARLIGLASKKMSERLQQRLDPEDVQQSVFATFFRRIENGQLELRDWESTWGLLAQIAVWRICGYAKHHSADCRSMQREASLHEALETINRDPSVQDNLIVLEMIEEITAGLTEVQKRAIQRHLEGASREEIAAESQISLATVDRILRRVRDRLTTLREQEAIDDQKR